MLDKAGIGGLAAQFLKLVAANRRLFAVRDMITGLSRAGRPPQGRGRPPRSRVAEQLKRRRISPPSSDALKAVTGKDVDLDVKVDPAIIGGLVVKLGSRMVDTSLRTKLNAIKHAMKEAR